MTPAWDPVGADPTRDRGLDAGRPDRAGHTGQPHVERGPVHENDVAWAVSAPVVASDAASGRRRGGRVRWAAALAIVVLILGTTAAVAAIITGRSAESTVIGYAPANTTMYMEVRLDLPGDQRQAIGAFLQKFPGFKDQAALDTKLDEVLDDLVREATDNQQTYTGDIKPWFDGELAYSMGPLPPAAALKDPAKSIGDFRVLALVSIKDPAGAQAWLDAQLTKAGATSTTEAYQGDTIHLFPESEGVQPAYAIVDGKVIALGDVASVKAAIDTNGSGGFADEPGPKAALGSVSGDHVGFAYIALRPLLAWSEQLSESMGAGGRRLRLARAHARPCSRPSRTGPPTGSSSRTTPSSWRRPSRSRRRPSARPRTGRSKIAEHIPSTAVVAATTNDLGKNLKQALDLYRSEPSFKSMIDQIDQGLGLVGGEDAAVGWVGDSAAVVDLVDGTPEGGLIVVADRSGRLPRSCSPRSAASSRSPAPSRASPSRTRTTTGRRSRPSTWATSASWPGRPARMCRCSRCRPATSRSPTRSRTRSSSSGRVPASSSTSSTRRRAPRWPRTTTTRSLVDRVGPTTGTIFVDITAIREAAEKAARRQPTRPGIKKYHDRHQAVPRAVRRADRRRAPSRAT